MGQFQFHAEPDPDHSACGLTEVPLDAGFDFLATFSRSKASHLYYVSIGGVPHTAVFDAGQTMVASYSAVRTFPLECACPDADKNPGVVTMTETIVAAVLSRSQSEAVGGCVPNPPVDPDAGIVLPDSTDGGFDAVEACGQLLEEVHVVPPPTAEMDDAGTCVFACNTCRLTYVISGGRK